MVEVTTDFDPGKWVLVPTLHTLERMRTRELSPSADVPEVVDRLKKLAREAVVVERGEDIVLAIGLDRTLVLAPMRVYDLDTYRPELERALSRFDPSYSVYVVTSRGCFVTSAGNVDVETLCDRYDRGRFSGDARTLVLCREEEEAFTVVTVRPPKRRERRLAREATPR